MPTELLKQRLNASTSMLAAERRRLEGELLKLEKSMARPNDTDDMVRELKRRVDAREAELARDRELLERAEAQSRTLERDRAAAQQAAHSEAVAQCKARLASLLDRELALVEHAERLARELLDARKDLLATLAEARAEAGRLGRADVLPSAADLTKRMSLREATMMSQLPGSRHQYGYVMLPSGSFGLIPDGLAWAEDEARHQRDARALIEQEG